MAYIPYTDSDEYQKEIAEQYKKRIGSFDAGEVVQSVHKLGFTKIKAEDLQTTTAGNMNATYLTPDLVIKINKRGDMPYFYANKVVSDKLGGKMPVVEVLAYDYFDKTGFEVLVMKKAPGQSMLDTIFDLPQEDVIEIFRQVLNVIKTLSTIQFDNFGWINLQTETYPTYGDFIKKELESDLVKIREQNLFREQDIEKVKQYLLNNLNVFNGETAVFVHTDTHMGNFLHVGNKLTALIDFDWSIKAPKFRALVKLLSFLYDPQQFTEGSSYYEKYKGKNFMFLMPALKTDLNELFDDKLLLKKLNIHFVSEGLRWIAQDWSVNWSKEMMKTILENELPETEKGLKQTYCGKILYEKNHPLNLLLYQRAKFRDFGQDL